jgi:hypothetical protein
VSSYFATYAENLVAVQALSPGMSLSMASQTLSRMLRARVHRHREGQVRLDLLALAYSSLTSNPRQ